METVDVLPPEPSKFPALPPRGRNVPHLETADIAVAANPAAGTSR